MAQYTPGPWQYGTKDDGYEISSLGTVYNVPTLATEDGKGQTYANISARVKCYEVTADQREANGRLMAAAPDLLDVAKCLRQHLALFCGPDDAIANEIFTISDAAIAKAEGRS